MAGIRECRAGDKHVSFCRTVRVSPREQLVGTFDGLSELLSSALVLERSVLWQTASAVKEGIDRLRTVTAGNVAPLEEVKEQLNVNSKCHLDFISQGGAKVLSDLLSTGNSAIQRKCMLAFEALALNEDSRQVFKETGIVDVLLKMIRASSRKPHSKRRQKAGEIIKLLAGCQRQRDMVQIGYSETRHMTSSSGLFRMDCYRERPLPLWYHTTNPVLPWDAEVVSCLVDMLMADLTKNGHEAAQRIIRKILHVSQYTRHIILDKRDISDMVEVISSMHSSAVLAMKVVTFVSIMHPSNDITFVRTGGLEGLVQAMCSDNIGSICGEMAAWTISYFASTSPENAKRIVEAGGAEALVELLHSPDYCAKEASARACVCLMRSVGPKNSLVREKLGEANAIPALLSALQDGQYHSRQQAVVMDVLRALTDMAKSEEYRREIVEAGGMETLSEGMMGSGKPVVEASKKLQRLVLSRSARLRMAWKGSRCQKKSGLARMVQKIRRVFRHKRNSSEQNGLYQPGTLGPDAISCSPRMGRWSSGYQVNLGQQRAHQRDQRRNQMSTASLTSFGALMAIQEQTTPSPTPRPNPTTPTSTPPNAHTAAPMETQLSSPLSDSPSHVTNVPQICIPELEEQSEMDPPPVDEHGVVVVTLNTQSTGSGSEYLHRSDFTKSSRSDLIATRDFI